MSECKPFMTIVTRTCRRPKAFARNCESVDMQTDQDIQHLILVDRAGRGIREANRRFNARKDLVEGEWVYILDDDNYLIDPTFVAEIRRISNERAAELIMVKGRWPNGLILPKPWNRRKVPHLCKVDSANFVVKVDPWRSCIHLFGVDERGGDHRVLAALFDRGLKVHWFDRIVFQVSQVGKGKIFEV